MNNNQPVKKFKAGSVNLCVWANDSIKGDGVMYRVTLERRYRDSSGNWQSTQSLMQNDIYKAIRALEKAADFIYFGNESESEVATHDD